MTGPDLRACYEADVAQLAQAAAAQLAAGAAEEDVARWLVDARNALKLRYREATPPAVVARIAAKTLTRYGNALGPSADDLRRAGKSWREIIASASRAGEHDADFFLGP